MLRLINVHSFCIELFVYFLFFMPEKKRKRKKIIRSSTMCFMHFYSAWKGKSEKEIMKVQNHIHTRTHLYHILSIASESCYRHHLYHHHHRCLQEHSKRFVFIVVKSISWVYVTISLSSCRCIYVSIGCR